MSASTLYLSDATQQFAKYKLMAERAMDQVNEKQLFSVPYEDGNSIAIVAKHMAGNMFSRWTDFMTTDGEKENRNRDDEFEMDEAWGRRELMAYWNRGWDCLFDALAPLEASDLEDTVTIRGESHSVVRAISRQMTHYAYHIGQIVLLARYYSGDNWRSLSIPRGQSKPFNAANWGKRSASRPELGQ